MNRRRRFKAKRLRRIKHIKKIGVCILFQKPFIEQQKKIHYRRELDKAEKHAQVGYYARIKRT